MAIGSNKTTSKQISAWATIAETRHKMETATAVEIDRLDRERMERDRRRAERSWWTQH